MARRVEISDGMVTVDGDDLPSVIRVNFDRRHDGSIAAITVEIDDDDEDLALPISTEEATQSFDANELGPVS